MVGFILVVHQDLKPASGGAVEFVLEKSSSSSFSLLGSSSSWSSS